ncbi:MAG: hypothetical protein KJP17_09665 [Gammaproteobacteria bacterium]|nr:hypothetical protein [Gammaproteobacteria bacterium]
MSTIDELSGVLDSAPMGDGSKLNASLRSHYLFAGLDFIAAKRILKIAKADVCLCHAHGVPYADVPGRVARIAGSRPLRGAARDREYEFCSDDRGPASII